MPNFMFTERLLFSRLKYLNRWPENDRELFYTKSWETVVITITTTVNRRKYAERSYKSCQI